MAGEHVAVDDLLADLKRLREVGLLKAGRRSFPALAVVARQAGLLDDDQPLDRSVVEDLLRAALCRFDDGPLREQAELGLGLLTGQRGLPPDERRRQAAEAYNAAHQRNILPSSYRKRPEERVLTELAIELQQLPKTIRQLQAGREQLERREPADTALAIDWRQRFEAYYRMWSSLSGLRNDLQVAQRSAAANEPDDVEEYAGYALFHYTDFLAELQRFQRDHGGLWLFSNRTAEKTVTQALHQLWLHVPLSERDASWLRMVLSETETGEVHSFLVMCENVHTGGELCREWTEWVIEDTRSGDPSAGSLQAILKACQTYLDTIDQEWYRVADWYRGQSSQ